MYIKQIIIQGFKSYKDQTVIEPFSPKHNVIVGRNGSGKSNFFAAIRFVLSDAYTQMGKEERQALLHEGTGPAVMSAFVEIIFDNSDERFPTGKPELILRRTIGIKKDEYTLDRKNATKSDVMNLLESAGFSRSNPYYIVPQGRVTALTNMKDSERLTLLKEVAGTQVYEARRTESLKIMTETHNKRAKIDELLAYINDRLNELEEEKEELKDFQEKDKERRCLQYTIDHREQVAISNELDNLDEQRQNGLDDNDDNQQRFTEGEETLASLDGEIRSITQQIELLRLDRNQLETERREAVKEKAKIELQLKTLSDGQAAAQQARGQIEERMQAVQMSIGQREASLNSIMPQFLSHRNEETRIKGELDDAEARSQHLYAKQGRNARFKTKKERDDWLRKEINDSRPQVQKFQNIRAQTTQEIAGIEEQVSSTESKMSNLRDQLNQRGDNASSMESQIQTCKTQREKLLDERKELWREEAKLDSSLSNAQKELSQAEQALSHRMDQNTSRGLAAVRRYKNQQGFKGAYGTLAELLDVEKENYRTAVEVTAGNSLFHYVVDNDDTASKLMELLNKERSGRITFMPLNRLKSKPGKVPNAPDAVPLLDRIKFDKKYERAFQQVFGRTIVCPNLTIAAQYARSHGVNAITLEGDRSDKKGALTGGFHDRRQSRLEAVKNVSKWRSEFDNQKVRLNEVKRTLERKDQEITQTLGNLQKLEQTKLRQEASYAPIQQELQRESYNLQVTKDVLENKTRALGNIDYNIKVLNDQASAHEAEISSEFKKALTQSEENQLETLTARIQDLRLQYAQVSTARSDLETQKSTLEIELRENLRPYLDQLSAQAFDNRSDGTDGDLASVQKELKKMEKTVSRVVKRLQEAQQSLEHSTGVVAELEQRRADTQQEQEEIAKSIERQQKRMEKSLQKKALLAKQAVEVAGRIRDLGVLPQEAFAKYEKMKSEAIVKRLHKVNEALKKYSHVNKKAFQQYEQFTNQRETLIKRRSELDSSQGSIEELIAHLDQRKDEAIERTFKQVSREFAKVFEILVPAGRGRLIIQRKMDRKGDEEESEEENRDSVENYTGVGISVSFNSKHDDQQRIQQLSGGQKSLCALALVFAIQRCDPAPFYLFDEIDANLDAQYRTAVAQMLQSISQNSETDGQFICTTFRPEMLLVAEKCYGVTYVKKSSKVLSVTRDEAMEFVQGDKR